MRVRDAEGAGGRTSIRLNEDRVLVDLDVLAKRYGFVEVFDALTRLNVTTGEGRVVLLVEAAAAPAVAKVRP